MPKVKTVFKNNIEVGDLLHIDMCNKWHLEDVVTWAFAVALVTFTITGLCFWAIKLIEWCKP